VNWSVALKGKAGWDGAPWTEEGWAILMICIVASITIVLLLHRTDWTFGAVIVWAFFAIGTEQFNQDLVPFVAFGLAGLLAALSLLALFTKVILWWREVAKENGSK